MEEREKDDQRNREKWIERETEKNGRERERKMFREKEVANRLFFSNVIMKANSFSNWYKWLFKLIRNLILKLLHKIFYRSYG